MIARDPSFIDDARRRHIVRARRQNAAFLTVALAVLLYALFPGRFDGDSISQHQMGVTFTFHDWHSPLMSAALGMLADLGDGPAPMFVVQLVVWAIGLALLTDTLIERGHTAVGQVISVVSVMPLVSFNFLEVQKDSLFTALVSVLIALGVRAILRPSSRTVIGVFCTFLLFAFALDVRTNGFFLLAGLLCLFFPLRSLGTRPVARTVSAVALTLALGLAVTGWLDRRVLGAARTHSLYSLMVFDLAGISYYAHADASQGLLPDFANASNRCYTPIGADPYLWGDCNIRGDLDRLMLADDTRFEFEKRWVTSILTHPISYLLHRVRHFGCYTRVGCGDFRWPMTPGLRYRRAWDPETPRISRPGRFMEGLAMKSYASPMMNGGVLIALFIAEILLVGALLRRQFEPIRYITLVLAASALVYELAFFIVGVSAAQRYVHVVVFIAGLTLPLSIASMRSGLTNQASAGHRAPSGARQTSHV